MSRIFLAPALLSLLLCACDEGVENEQLTDEQLAERADELTARANELVEERLAEDEDAPSLPDLLPDAESQP